SGPVAPRDRGAFWRHNSGDRWHKKAPEVLGSSGARTSVRRRPGYSLSGCTPAEPDSASPGGILISSFMEERYANCLKKAGPCAQCRRQTAATKERAF